MARKRMIDPKFWTDDKIMDLDPLTRLLFIGIWNFSDDCGIHLNNSKVLKAEIFPSDDIQIDEVQKMKDQLNNLGMIEISKDRQLFRIKNWKIYQKINRPQPCKYEFIEDTVNSQTQVIPNRIEEEDNIIKKKEIVNVSKPKKTSTLKPYKTRVEEYFKDLKNDEEFMKLLEEAYPNIDISIELNKAKTWLLVNTHKAKKNFKRFVNNWCSSAMESAGRYQKGIDGLNAGEKQMLKAREEQIERDRRRQIEYNKKMEKEAATPEEIKAALSQWTTKGDKDVKSNED
tara:strand:+ start:413 stop:1270 length:858 start_codon:yes stop_codon:yes gene_type:complete